MPVLPLEIIGPRQKIITDSCSYKSALLTACKRKKNISKSLISSKQAISSSDVFEKSINIYDLYSLMANCSAIVDLPTRLAPSSNTAYLSIVFSLDG